MMKSSNIGDIAEEIFAESYVVHRSYIVNLRKITEVSRLRIIFNKNIYIPVGDNYKERFTEYINKICVSS